MATDMPCAVCWVHRRGRFATACRTQRWSSDEMHCDAGRSRHPFATRHSRHRVHSKDPNRRFGGTEAGMAGGVPRRSFVRLDFRPSCRIVARSHPAPPPPFCEKEVLRGRRIHVDVVSRHGSRLLRVLRQESHADLPIPHALQQGVQGPVHRGEWPGQLRFWTGAVLHSTGRIRMSQGRRGSTSASARR